MTSKSFNIRFLFPALALVAGLSLTLQGQQPVKIDANKRPGFLEIRNSLLGIVVPSTAAFIKGRPCPAPIQALIYSDDVYSDNSINYLRTKYPVIGMKTTIVTNTPDKAVVQLDYDCGANAGQVYSFRLQLNKNEKFVLIEEDARTNIAFDVKISNGLNPDRARYRGWASAGKQLGYEPSGAPYRSEDERQTPLDASIDLDYRQPASYQRLVLWEPAGGEINSGRYWQVYNSKAAQDANLFGFFQGQPSRLVGARSVGPNLQVLPNDRANNEKDDAELADDIDLRSPDNVVFLRKRFQWGIYISTKKDLLPEDKTQPIGIAMNKVAGLGSVIKEYANKPVKLIPAFYTGAIYMPADKVAALCSLLKTDRALYEKLLQTEGGFASLWRIWNTNGPVREDVKYLLNVKKEMEDNYSNGEGTYNREYRYWKGTKLFKYYAIIISCIFADKTKQLTAAERTGLEQLVGLMARITWDDNNVPLFEGSGINLGPQNMAYQYRNNGRYFFALLLKDDPEFSERAKQVAKAVNDDIESALAANGASFGTPHYTQAVIEPLLFSMLQLKHAGVADFFKTNPKVRAFAKFYLSLLTPPSPRFLNYRKLISFGDGSEESAASYALLATGFADIDADLSAQLMAAFNYGPQRSSIHGLVRLAADLTITPNKKVFPGTSNYTGYDTHYRTGVNTIDETAAWILNGELLKDHRNDDAGETAIYALGAPLSVSRSCFYSPSATDARIRSVVVPEKLFPSWNGDNQPIAGHSLTNRTWPSSALLEFASLGYSCSSKIKMASAETEWYRKFTMLALPNHNPIFVYYDSITGGQPNIWSMMMMSEGPVGTPAGNITPEKRIYNNSNLQQLPSGTAVKNINPGLNRFSFTGQSWVAHATGGINWNLYTLSGSSMAFSLADWSTTWQNQEEQEEFVKTNHRPYSEEQEIIRLKSNTPFFTILLPVHKGKDVYSAGVQQTENGNAFQIAVNNGEIRIGKNGYYAKDDERVVVASWNPAERTVINGYSLSGGYSEIEKTKTKLKLRVHGNGGNRTIGLPYKVTLDGASKDITVRNTSTGCSIAVVYKAGTMELASGDKGYTEYNFSLQ